MRDLRPEVRDVRVDAHIPNGIDSLSEDAEPFEARLSSHASVGGRAPESSRSQYDSRSVTGGQAHEHYEPAKYWDDVAQEIAARPGQNILAGDDSPILAYQRSRFLEVFLDALPVSGKDVLEVGCGPGGNLIELARRNANRVCGCDVAPQMLALASSNTQNYASVQVQQVDGQRLPYSTAEFDVALTVTVLMHNMDEMLAPLLLEIARVTRGDLVLIETTTDAAKRSHYSFVLRRPAEYEQILEPAGFRLVDHERLRIDATMKAHRVLTLAFRRWTSREGVRLPRPLVLSEQLVLTITRRVDPLIRPSKGLTKMHFRRVRDDDSPDR